MLMVSHVSHINWVIQTFQLEPLQVVRIESIDMRSQLYRKLVYKKKFRGRGLVSDFPTLGLKKGSRLLPTAEIPDVGQFEFLTPPFTTSWWVGADDARLVHDCPLLQLSGVGLEMWSLDIIHSWHLGPLQLLVSLAFNFCLDSGIWAPTSTGLDAAEKRKLSLFAIKAELFQFYRDQKKDPSWVGKSSEVSWFTQQLLCFPTF